MVSEKVEEKQYCDKCGKCVSQLDKNGEIIGSACGIEFALYGVDRSAKWRKFIDTQLGKYAGREKVRFCFECWLDVLFNETLCIPTK